MSGLIRQIVEVGRVELRCPYCEAGHEYGEHVIPPDDCCPPRALDQLAWMVEYLQHPAQVKRLDAGDAEVLELADTARNLRHVLRRMEAETPGALQYAVSAVEERYGRSDRRASAARRIAATLGRIEGAAR